MAINGLSNKFHWSNSILREINFESCYVEINLDCYYTFLIELTSNRIQFVAKWINIIYLSAFKPTIWGVVRRGGVVRRILLVVIETVAKGDLWYRWIDKLYFDNQGFLTYTCKKK